MRRQLIIAAVLTVGGLGSWAPQSRAEVEVNTWTEVENAADGAVAAAEVLGKQLASRLLREQSRVIFLNLRECAPNIGRGDDGWCGAFQSRLATHLVREGIRFLPEDSVTQIRAKIAQEQVYQHGSMQVDVTKAVQLGKQKAFQAFTTVRVIGDRSGDIHIESQSINIRDGVVSVSEAFAVRRRVDVSKTIGSYLKGSAYMMIGLGIAAGGIRYGMQEKSKADDTYAQYEATKDAAEASRLRQKTQEHDNSATIGYGVGAIGAIFAVYGMTHWGSEEYQTSYYKVDTASHDRRPRIGFPVVMGGRGLGISLSWSP